MGFFNGTIYCHVTTVCITYNVSASSMAKWGVQVDHGANGGIAGDNVRIIVKTVHQVDIQRIENHWIVDIPIVTVGSVINTQKGQMIAILHQYAKEGKSIHSYSQP